jgi:hypothetical protein
MTNSEEAARALRTFEALAEHAQYYKGMFHDSQEKLIAALDKCAERGRVIDQQRRVIAKLESDLGVDQDL